MNTILLAAVLAVAGQVRAADPPKSDLRQVVAEQQVEIADLKKRVAELEKRLAALEPKEKPAARTRPVAGMTLQEMRALMRSFPINDSGDPNPQNFGEGKLVSQSQHGDEYEWKRGPLEMHATFKDGRLVDWTYHDPRRD